MAYLWPGLPHLWVEGSWAGLTLAIGFTVLFNLAVVNLFIWPELLQAEAKWVGGAALAMLWMAALVETRGELRRQAERKRAEAEDRVDPETERQNELDEENTSQLVAAQQLYLAGDLLSAERTLVPLTKSNKQDLEAQLLLATVWRRQGRAAEATRRLNWLLKLEAATEWRFEIDTELRFAQQAGEATNTNNEGESDVLTDPPAEAA